MKTIINKQIEDIFSYRKKEEKEKTKIIIDYREKNSLVPAKLMSLDFEIEFRELKIADYIVKEVAIERKTINDFISSMINKRLVKQLEELQNYEKRLLIIEGFEEQDLFNDNLKKGVNPNALRGFIISILFRYKVPIIFTKNSEDTAKFLAVIANKTEKEVSLKEKKKTFSQQEQMQFILEGFPGIGPKTAKRLLEKFKTLKNIFNSSEEELKEMLGKKTESFRKIIEENY